MIASTSAANTPTPPTAAGSESMNLLAASNATTTRLKWFEGNPFTCQRSGRAYRGLAATSPCAWFSSLSENTCVALFHTRRISSRLLLVFDFSSSICRFASAPAVSTSPFTWLWSPWIQASRPLALGWRGALLGLTVASPGAEAVWAIRGGLPADDRVGSGAPSDGRPGQARGGE